MTKQQLDFYQAGIMDANDARRVVFAAYSKRYEALNREYHLKIGKESLKMLDAYNLGVAYETERQARLAMK